MFQQTMTIRQTNYQLIYAFFALPCPADNGGDAVDNGDDDDDDGDDDADNGDDCIGYWWWATDRLRILKSSTAP